ncbi:TPA: hypothetical protein HA265_00510 [Candidatus Woesearchaeota archaeon]|nr:hypothetical protein [Candidatus Woesearchaeota archaeon]
MTATIARESHERAADSYGITGKVIRYSPILTTPAMMCLAMYEFTQGMTNLGTGLGVVEGFAALCGMYACVEEARRK